MNNFIVWILFATIVLLLSLFSETKEQFINMIHSTRHWRSPSWLSPSWYSPSWRSPSWRSPSWYSPSWYSPSWYSPSWWYSPWNAPTRWRGHRWFPILY